MVRVNKAGCLDQCERGVTVVIYPQGLWYGGVAVEDVPAIVDALEQGSQVEHLVIADEDLTGRARSET
jgi:(2Fe-2S) ferredoxin